MAGFHLTASDAWLHTRAQNLGHFLGVGGGDLGWESKIMGGWGIHASQGTYSSFPYFFRHLLILFSKLTFWKNSFRNTISVSNRFERLSAEDKILVLSNNLFFFNPYRPLTTC